MDALELRRQPVVLRDAKPVIPPRVDYSLTELGKEAADQVNGIAHWTERRMTAVQKARADYDAAKARLG
ncbi:winged helix-turn-helix transcriptional regulator [Amycolatopsis coloradensis]|uniref:Winged helix-turn-helix transcriptional regulator n=1 Tax=Amycolatopsis coloradensis TaxID=76021 RepID=A0ACD5BEA5_9PSEU